MSSQARPGKRTVLIKIFLATACLYTNAVAETKRLGEPFNSFRTMDAQLSILDAQFSGFRSGLEQVGKIRSKRAREKAYKLLQRSKTSWEIRSTVSSIRTTARTLASSSAMRRSRYGKIIARALSRRADTMQRDVRRLTAAQSRKQANVYVRKFSDSMLGLVVQFQAVSGGYGALQCSPGSWTCCGRKKVPSRQGVALNGCAWICVKRTRACRSGCLGPPTPLLAQRRASLQQRRPTAALRPHSPGIRFPSSEK